MARCAPGYVGALCALCDTGYYKRNSGECVQCDTYSTVLTVMVMVMVVCIPYAVMYYSIDGGDDDSRYGLLWIVVMVSQIYSTCGGGGDGGDTRLVGLHTC